MEKLLQAAQIALDIPLRYLNVGSNMAIAALAGAKQFEYLQHYPANDVIDPVHHTRFFYHGHSSKKQAQHEHGHFHIFVYFPGSEEINFSHVAGLSLDEKGQALRWFTTNRWVTAENWRPAKELITLLPNIRLHARGRLAPVAKWLEAMLILFQIEIEAMLIERDALVDREIELRFLSMKGYHQDQSQCRHDVFEDRELDVISECNVSLHERMQRIMCSSFVSEL